MRIFRVMNSFMKKHFGLITLSLFMGVFTIMSSLGMLSSSSVLISKAALHPDISTLMVLIIAIRFFSISRGVFRYLERIFSHNTTFRILSSIRKWFYKKINENYLENHREFKTGDIYTKIVNDVDTLKDYFLRGVYPLIIAAATGILTTLFLMWFSKTTACIYAVIYFLSGFVLPIILFKLNSRIVIREEETKKELNLVVLEALRGGLETVLYSLRDDFINRFNNLSNLYLKLQRDKNLTVSLGDNVYGLSVSLLVALALKNTAPLVEANKLPGIYFAMIALSIMASFEALIPMPNIVYKFYEAYNAGKNIFSIIDEGTRENNSLKGKITGCDLSAEKFSVSGFKPGHFIIKDVSFELPYGKKIAIVGESGSGKSTILKALLGFMKLSDGDIKIASNSYLDLDMDEVRKAFTYVDQNPYLFNTTIRENLLIADPEMEETSLFEILERAQIMGLVNGREEKLDTLLGQYGSNISGGERQRIAIARALIKNSPIVLLDEPTAGLDVKLEKKVVEAVHQIIGDKSCIWVTHRLIDMDRFDEILVLHEGEIAERGNHRELLNKKGRYHKLWSVQQQYVLDK